MVPEFLSVELANLDQKVLIASSAIVGVAPGSARGSVRLSLRGKLEGLGIKDGGDIEVLGTVDDFAVILEAVSVHPPEGEG